MKTHTLYVMKSYSDDYLGFNGTQWYWTGKLCYANLFTSKRGIAFALSDKNTSLTLLKSSDPKRWANRKIVKLDIKENRADSV